MYGISIKKNANNFGFTLIELLLVISLIGILAGITLSVINPTKQRQLAEDGVRRSNVEKLVQSVEAFCEGEGACPAAADWADSASVLRTVYIKAFPTDASYTYLVSIPSDFEIRVPLSTNSARYLRYNSVWGKIDECANLPATWSTTCTP